MARAYLLMNVLPGKEKDICHSIRGAKGVVAADVITGNFDIIATIEAKDINDIFNKILKDLRKIRGLKRTETYIAVE